MVLRLLVARGKVSEDVVENPLTWRHPGEDRGHSSGFSVHAGAPVESRSEAVRLGRYGIRCPLLLQRLAWDETSGEVVYRARPGHHDARGESTARWGVLEFLARVPEPSHQLLRFRPRLPEPLPGDPRAVRDVSDSRVRVRHLRQPLQ